MKKKELIKYINEHLPSPLFYLDNNGNVKWVAKEIMRKGKPNLYSSKLK